MKHPCLRSILPQPLPSEKLNEAGAGWAVVRRAGHQLVPRAIPGHVKMLEDSFAIQTSLLICFLSLNGHSWACFLFNSLIEL